MEKKANGNNQNYGMEKRGGNDKPAPQTPKPAQRPPSQLKKEK